MLKEIIFMVLPFLKPLIVKVIERIVLFAEEKFSHIWRAGRQKKIFVLEETYEYLKNNPDVMEELKKMYGDRMKEEIDKLIEKAVLKLT